MKEVNKKVQAHLPDIIASSIDVLFTPKTKAEEHKQQVEELFEEIPVTFREFVVSKDHMNSEALSERQYLPCDFLLGNDVTRIFDNGNTTAVCAWGKGSGKDYISALVILYLVYVLLCMKDPQKYLKIDSAEAIDILNVAVSADQANDVFFEKFKQRLLKWEWLKARYALRLSGTYLGKLKKQTFEEIQKTVMVTKDAILFPKLIRAISGHSKSASQEGHGLVAFIMDEAAAFEHADDIYNTLRTSAVSRFGDRYKCFLLSFPRYDGDFILRMYDESLQELHWYGDKAATWEVKPERYFSGKWFDLHGERIPLEYKIEFAKHPEESYGKYLCRPPHIENPFIEQPEKVDQAIINQPPKIILLDRVRSNMVCKDIGNISTDSRMMEHILTMDLGVKNNSAAMTLAHREMDIEGRDIYIQDFCTTWVPDEAQKLLVDFLNIRDIIFAMKEKINLVGVYFDQWQSVMMVQSLVQKGILSEVYSLDFADYKNYKEKLYLGQVKIQNDPILITELKKLKLLKGNKVDHPKKGSKDLADTLVMAVKVLSSRRGGEASQYSMEGEMVGFNLTKEGGEFIA